MQYQDLRPGNHDHTLITDHAIHRFPITDDLLGESASTFHKTPGRATLRYLILEVSNQRPPMLIKMLDLIKL